ncbi:MAG: hypothetical protein LBJ67_06035 [Planctomycetaceae bacterium]|nr:hypothetical protein [Planctomycetaceae bacterium]
MLKVCGSVPDVFSGCRKSAGTFQTFSAVAESLRERSRRFQRLLKACGRRKII